MKKAKKKKQIKVFFTDNVHIKEVKVSIVFLALSREGGVCSVDLH